MNGALDFVCTSNPARIVFGTGSMARLADELRAAGRRRALILSTPFQRDAAMAMAARLGDLAAGIFAEAAMHTPMGVTDRAMAAYAAARADCTVALGGRFNDRARQGHRVAQRCDTGRRRHDLCRLRSHPDPRPDREGPQDHRAGP